MQQKTVGSIPGQDAYLGCGFGTGQGVYNVSLSHQYFSPSFFPSHPVSLKLNKQP